MKSKYNEFSSCTCHIIKDKISSSSNKFTQFTSQLSAQITSFLEHDICINAFVNKLSSWIRQSYGFSCLDAEFIHNEVEWSQSSKQQSSMIQFFDAKECIINKVEYSESSRKQSSRKQSSRKQSSYSCSSMSQFFDPKHQQQIFKAEHQKQIQRLNELQLQCYELYYIPKSSLYQTLNKSYKTLTQLRYYNDHIQTNNQKYFQPNSQMDLEIQKYINSKIISNRKKQDFLRFNCEKQIIEYLIDKKPQPKYLAKYYGITLHQVNCQFHYYVEMGDDSVQQKISTQTNKRILRRYWRCFAKGILQSIELGIYDSDLCPRNSFFSLADKDIIKLFDHDRAYLLFDSSQQNLQINCFKIFIEYFKLGENLNKYGMHNETNIFIRNIESRFEAKEINYIKFMMIQFMINQQVIGDNLERQKQNVKFYKLLIKEMMVDKYIAQIKKFEENQESDYLLTYFKRQTSKILMHLKSERFKHYFFNFNAEFQFKKQLNDGNQKQKSIWEYSKQNWQIIMFEQMNSEVEEKQINPLKCEKATFYSIKLMRTLMKMFDNFQNCRKFTLSLTSQQILSLGGNCSKYLDIKDEFLQIKHMMRNINLPFKNLAFQLRENLAQKLRTNYSYQFSKSLAYQFRKSCLYCLSKNLAYQFIKNYSYQFSKSLSYQFRKNYQSSKKYAYQPIKCYLYYFAIQYIQNHLSRELIKFNRRKTERYCSQLQIIKNKQKILLKKSCKAKYCGCYQLITQLVLNNIYYI